MMNEGAFTVRKLGLSDLDAFWKYWFESDETYLTGMGVDLKKLPTKEAFFAYWETQLQLPADQVLSYCLIWEKDEKPIGHSSTRPTHFGKDAYMHLHIWSAEHRQKGIGFELMNLTIPCYFETLQLKELYCEPYAINQAPNKLLEKLGFDFVEERICIPGPFNFEQPVKLWHLSYGKYRQLYKTGT